MATLICLFGAAWGAGVHAQSVTDGVVINADNMDRDLARGVVRLSGHIQIVFQGQSLRCDHAEMNLKEQSLRADGHVFLDGPKAHVEADRLVFNYKQNTGYIYNGYVQSGQVVFRGAVVEKVGDAHYIASEAEYTACETCPPGWSFAGRVIDAEMGGYARIKRPVFKIAGFPVLILPSLIVPLKSSRQSGFLVPTMEYSGRSGFGLGESYFWAIDRSHDVTATAKRYAISGTMLQESYRFVLSEKSSGKLNSAWIPDRAFARDPTNGLDHTLDRYYVDYFNHFEMPGNLVQRADLHLVSDLRYPRDFPDQLPGHGDPALENRVSLTKSSDDHYVSLEADMYTNLLKSNPLAPNDDAVHRMPEFQYSLKEIPLGENWPYLSLDVNYVNFARNSSSYDALDPQTNLVDLGPRGEIPHGTTFHPFVDSVPADSTIGPDFGHPGTDINRTGDRLEVRPTLTYPFQLGRKFEILPLVRFRETQYRFNTESARDNFSRTAARRYLQDEIRAKTEFTRVFGGVGQAADDPAITKWKHSFEPEVGFSQTPFMRKPNHAFFGDFRGIQLARQYEPITDNNFVDPNTKLQFDFEDRTIDRRVVDFVLTNRITRKTWVNGQPDYRSAALFRVWQAYDFTAIPHAWSSLGALLDVRGEHFETNTILDYNGYVNVFNVNSRVKALVTPKNFIELTYNKHTDVTSDYRIDPGETRNLGFGAGVQTKMLEVAGQIEYALNTAQIQQWAYELYFRPPGRCWLLKFDHRQIFGGDRQFHFAASFDFGGEKQKSVN